MKKTSENKTVNDIYTQVTTFVIEQLEKGVIVWKQGWNSHGLPKNFVTGNTYRGWNLFLLNFITLMKGYPSPYFLTFKQAQAKGGRIRKGEKGIQILYWAKIEDKNSKTEEVEQEDNVHTVRLVPRLYVVFNIAQTEGIELPSPQIPEQAMIDSLTACDEIVAQMPNAPKIRYYGESAWYSPARDLVNMPEKRLFTSTEEHYCALFHELAHATGHASRLNRVELVTSDGFAGELYSKEELTAELTAAFLCAVGGIEQGDTLINSAAYIQGWLASFNNDKTMIVKAAAQAQKAADYILNRKEEPREPALN